MTNFEEQLKNYVNEFCNYFEDAVEHEDLNFYDFSRTFEDVTDNFQDTDNSKQTDAKKFKDLKKAFDDNNQCLLLLGEPGAGKTVLLRNFAKEKGIERQNNTDALLPIFASIWTWDAEKEKDTEKEQQLINWLIEEGVKVKQYIDEDLLKQKLKDNQVLLLLDGLDELPEDVTDSKNPNAEPKNYRVEFINLLNDFLQKERYKHNQIIVTCRTEDYKEIIENHHNLKLMLNGVVNLQLLNYGDIKKYLKEKLEDNSVSKITSILIENTALRKMVYIPFLLTVLVLSYQVSTERDENEAEQLKKIDKPDKLLDYFVDNLYKREKEKKANEYPFELSEFKQKLGQAAVLMMSDKQPDDNEIPLKIFKNIIPDNNDIKKRNLFIELSKNSYLLALTHNKEKETYRFRHLLLRDYFAFSYVNKFLNSASQTQDLEENIPKKEEIAKALGKLNRPEATDFLISLLEDSDKDVRYEAANSLGQLNAGFYFRGYQKDFDQDCLFYYQLSITDNPVPAVQTVPIEDLIKYVGELKSGNEELQARLNEVDKKLETLEFGLSDTDKKITTLQADDISELKSENKELQARLNKVEEKLQKLQPPLIVTPEYSDISQLKSQIEQLQAGLKEVNEKLETLQSQLSDIDNILPSQQNDISELKSQNEQLQSKLDQASNQLKELRSKLSDTDKRITTLQPDEIPQPKSENKELQAKLDKISNQLVQLQSKLSKTDKKIEDNYQTISQKIEKIYQEILELQKRISELPNQNKREPNNKRDPWNI